MKPARVWPDPVPGFETVTVVPPGTDWTQDWPAGTDPHATLDFLYRVNGEVGFTAAGSDFMAEPVMLRFVPDFLDMLDAMTETCDRPRVVEPTPGQYAALMEMAFLHAWSPCP